jgi:hypothetical protein
LAEDGPYRPAPDLEAVDMTPIEGETQRMRELHEYYVWQVNAAVAEGRDDLVAELADDYLEVALAEMADARPADTTPDVAPDPPDLSAVEPTGDGRWEVVDCRPTRMRWWRRLLSR